MHSGEKYMHRKRIGFDQQSCVWRLCKAGSQRAIFLWDWNFNRKIATLTLGSEILFKYSVMDMICSRIWHEANKQPMIEGWGRLRFRVLYSTLVKGLGWKWSSEVTDRCCRFMWQQVQPQELTSHRLKHACISLKVLVDRVCNFAEIVSNSKTFSLFLPEVFKVMIKVSSELNHRCIIFCNSE